MEGECRATDKHVAVHQTKAISNLIAPYFIFLFTFVSKGGHILSSYSVKGDHITLIKTYKGVVLHMISFIKGPN